MGKLSKKAVGTVMAGVMTIGAVAGSVNGIENIKVVSAAESKALKNAKAKISHLTWSLKNNYLGIKNQAQWEVYVKEARELIAKMPTSEKKQADLFTEEVNRDAAMIQGLARINHVEKSMETNYNGIKNARQWREYLNLANEDLAKVDQKEFKKQYDELVKRMNECAIKVTKIENDFKKEYDAAIVKYYEALKSKNLVKAEEALAAAEKLGTCEESDSLEQDCKKLIADIKGSEVMVTSVEALNAKEIVVKFNKEVDETKVADAVTITDKNGQVTFTLGEKSSDGKTFTLVANKIIDVENASLVVDKIPTKADGNIKTDKYAATFTYKDKEAPSVVKVEAKDKKAVITFKEDIEKGATVSVNGQNYSDINISGKTLTINSLENGKTYTSQIVGVKDVVGNIANPINISFTVSKSDTTVKQEVTTSVNENKVTLKFTNPISASNNAKVLFVNGKNYYDTALDLNGDVKTGVTYLDDNKTVVIDTQRLNILGNLEFLNTDIKISGAGLEKDVVVDARLSSDKTAPKLVSLQTSSKGDITLEFNEEVKLTAGDTIDLKVTSIDGVYQSNPAIWSNLKVEYAKDKNNNDIKNKLVIASGNLASVNKKYTVEVPSEIQDIYGNKLDKFSINILKSESDENVNPEAKITVDTTVNKNVIKLTFANVASGKVITSDALEADNYTLGGNKLPDGTIIRYIDNKLNVEIILPEGSIITDGSYVLTMKNIKDEFGNTLKSGQESKVVNLVENVAPRVTTLSITSSENVNITFSERVSFDDINKDKKISGVTVEVNDKVISDPQIILASDGKTLMISGLSLKSDDKVKIKFSNAELFDKSDNKNQLKNITVNN